MAYLEKPGTPGAPKPAERTIKQNWGLQIGPWLALMLFLVAWEIAAYFGWVARLFFPAPSVIGLALWKMILSGRLVDDMQISLYRLGSGLLIGGFSGALSGIVLGWSLVARRLAEPFVAAIHPLPKIALLPLVLIIFGIGEESKIVLIALAAFFPMLINAMVGVQQIEGIYWEVAANYGAGGVKLLLRVLLPGSMPYLLAGFRLSLNAALVVTLAVEQLTARQGLGANIWLAWETMRTEELYATLFVIALLGLVTNWLSSLFARRMAPWRLEQNN